MNYWVILLFMFLLVFTFAVVNSYFIRSATVKDYESRKIWHIAGTIHRAFILLLVLYLFLGNWDKMILATLFFLNLSWTMYDAVINFILTGRLLHKGTTAKTDKFLSVKVEWIFKGILFIGLVLMFIRYIR